MTMVRSTRNIDGIAEDQRRLIISLKNPFKCFLILIFFAASLFCGKGGKIYKNGDLVPKLIFKNLKDNVSSLEKGNFNVILFFEYLESDPAISKYISRIYLDKYKELGLKIVLITNSKNDKIEDLIKKYNVSFPVLPLNKNRDILQKFFDTELSDRALIIINPEMKLESIYYFFKEEDVRQLFEKYLTGTISYSNDIKIDKLAVGNSFPEVNIIKLGLTMDRSETNTSKHSPQLWFLFSSKCVTCALKNYLLQYKLIENKLSGKLQVPKGLIFSQYFQEDEILEKIKFYKIETKVYLSAEEIAGFESEYYQNAAEDNIVVVLTDKQNIMIYIDPFPDFVMKFSGGSFDEILSNL